MSKQTTKPTHNLVRYYDSGRNAPSARIGAIWTREDGSLAIRLDTLEEQIWLQGFPIDQETEGQDAA